MNIKPIRIFVLIACLAQFVTNFAGEQIFGYASNVEISDRYTTIITPADFTFAVWGFIFLGSLIYSVYQLLPSTQEQKWLDRLAPYAIGTYLTCAIWPIPFGFERFILAQVIIIALLASLIGAFLVIRQRDTADKLSTVETSFVKLPFSIYFAWVTVATVVGLGLTLVTLGWSGFGIGDISWGVIILLAVLAITAFVVAVSRGNLGYTAVIVWAMYGIIMKDVEQTPIVAMAGLIAVTVTIIALFSRFKQSRSPSPQLV